MVTEQKVSRESGESFAKEHDMALFMETSAKDNVNIDKAFDTFTQLILDRETERKRQELVRQASRIQEEEKKKRNAKDCFCS